MYIHTLHCFICTNKSERMGNIIVFAPVIIFPQKWARMVVSNNRESLEESTLLFEQESALSYTLAQKESGQNNKNDAQFFNIKRSQYNI